MANNPYVNKVVKNGVTVIDLTGDDVTAADVAAGKMFHLPSGAAAVGTGSGGGGDPEPLYTEMVTANAMVCTMTPTMGINTSGDTIAPSGTTSIAILDTYDDWGIDDIYYDGSDGVVYIRNGDGTITMHTGSGMSSDGGINEIYLLGVVFDDTTGDMVYMYSATLGGEETIFTMPNPLISVAYVSGTTYTMGYNGGTENVVLADGEDGSDGFRSFSFGTVTETAGRVPMQRTNISGALNASGTAPFGAKLYDDGDDKSYTGYNPPVGSNRDLITQGKLQALAYAILGSGQSGTIDQMIAAVNAMASFDWSQIDGITLRYKSGTRSLDCSGIDTSGMSSLGNLITTPSGYNNLLASIDVSGFDTSNVRDMSGTFYNCKSLTSLDLSNWNAGKVTTLASIFAYCEALQTIDFGDGFKSMRFLTGLYQTFAYCKQLDFSCLEDLDTSKATNFSSMFSYAITNANRYGGTTLDASVLDLSSATNISYMFNYCSAMTALDVSGLDVSKVTNASYAFYYCEALTSLDLGDWHLDAVSNIGYMFYYCSALTSVNLSNLSTQYVTSSYNARSVFSQCPNLVDIIWSQKDTVQAIPTTPANMGITSSMKIYVPDDLVSSYKSASNWSTIESQIYSINDLPAAVKTLYNIS